MADSETATDDSGQYSFTGLRAGTYSVEISGFDSNEVSFSSTSGAATVGVGESKVVSFDGTYLRTAGIMGRVSAEGEGLPNVTVTLMGQGDDIPPATTDAGGLYSFSQLRSGDYTVAISGYDTDDYEFSTTSKSVTIATGETANVPFEGTLLRTAGIAGRVSLDDGMGLDGVTVTLAGAAEATAETANGGQYSFAGLAAGTYVLSITNPNETAYNFAEGELQKTVMLEDDDSEIVNFEGTHTRTASVSGMLFIDEVDRNKMHDDGEPSVAAALLPFLATLDDEARMKLSGLLAKAKVILRGPDLNTIDTLDIDLTTGTFTTGASLMAGPYQVELPVNDEDVEAGLNNAGIAFVGESKVVNVEAGGSARVNFPFRITMQTVATGARMGAGEGDDAVLGVPVPGVKLALYARADGTGMLGEATTDSTGMASFTFARDDNTGPAGNDNIVFVKAVETGHDALVVSGNEFVEFSYEGVERLSTADQDKEVATLVNVAVAFDFWVKSNETARDGNMGLGGWNTQVYMGDPKADDAMPLMVEEDGEMVNATKPTDDGEEDMDDLGKSSFSYRVDPTKLPAMFTVMATQDDKAACSKDGKSSDQPDQCEVWDQSDALTHTHSGLDLPPGKDDDPIDKGAIRITYKTQALYVGVHRELDDRLGFTKFRGVGGGDARPSGKAVGKIEIRLLKENEAGRPRPYEYDHDMDPTTPDIEAEVEVDKTGMASFKHLPADDDIIVEVESSSGIITVPTGRDDREINAYGDGLDDMPGLVKGAFGTASGGRPDVWLCPLGDSADDCSTFAYKWNDGKITGTVGGLKRGDTKVEVTLVPVGTPYADDLEEDDEVAWNGTRYTFNGVADGSYRVRLEARAGSWDADSTKVIDIFHNENPRGDDTGAKEIDANADEYGGGLSATSLRSGIRGTVANDASGNGSLGSSEAIAGVELELYDAIEIDDEDSDDHEKYKVGDPVEDESGETRTATTDSDGLYVFPKLVDGKKYFVKAKNTDDYSVVRNRGATEAGKAGDVTSLALATAAAITGTYTEPTPTWDYLASKAEGVGSSHFVLLHHDGTAEGAATDPSTRRRHADTYIELQRCLSVEDVVADVEGTANTIGIQPGDECDDEADEDPIEVPVTNTRTNTGAWETTGLMEGVYGVEVDLPSGYELVNASGGSETPDPVVRFLIIVQGSRDDAEMLTYDETSGEHETADIPAFWLKRRNAQSVTTLATDPVEAEGETCTADAVCVHTDKTSIEVTVTATDDKADIRLSPHSTNRNATGSIGVTSGEEKTISMNPQGRFRSYYVHVAADDGYAKNTDGGAAAPRYFFRRNADVRLDTLVVSYTDNDGATRTAYDRVALKLNPDGEVGPTFGRTDLGKIVIDDAGDGTAALEIGLIFRAMQRAYGAPRVSYIAGSSVTAPTACPGGSDNVTAAGTAELAADPGTGAAQTRVCFDIVDDNTASDANALDTNTNNVRRYQILFERKRAPSG